jgi:YD repeat-containing protein
MLHETGFTISPVVRLARIFAACVLGFIMLTPLARAQCPPDCIDTEAPTVSITPSGVQASAGVTVSIAWRDNVALDPSSRSILLNGTNVTASFNYTVISDSHGTSTGTITLTPGRHTLVASISDVESNTGSRSEVFVFGVWVTPHSASAAAHAGTNSYGFTVQNTGSSAATLTIAPDCTGLTSCSLSTTSLTLGGGASSGVTLTYQAGSIGTAGTGRLKAWYASNSNARDSGAVSVTVQHGFTSTIERTVNDNQNLTVCAHDCFVPVYAQGTVPYFSLGSPRNIALIYHGERVALRPFVYADVTSPFPDDTVTQYSFRVLRLGNHLPFTNGDSVLLFRGSSQPVRVAGQLDLQNEPTGAIDIQIVVKAQFAARTEEQSWPTKLLVVNERGSSVARGWMIAWVQRLRTQADGSVVLTDGSGSALSFASCGGGCFFAPAGEFSTLSSTGSGTSTVYTRAFADSTKVRFNHLGYMTALRNRFGDSTVFDYDGSGRLTRVRDPLRIVQATGERAYLELVYNSYGLAQVREPGPAGEPGGGRITTFTVAGDSTLSSIADPDGVSTRFLYTSQRELERVINRRGDTSRYFYHATFRTLDSVSTPRVPIDVGGGATTLQALVTKLVPWRTRGVPVSSTAGAPATPVAQSAIVASVTPPGAGTTTFTVDRWGQPLLVTDPRGKTTTIARSGIPGGQDRESDGSGGHVALQQRRASGLPPHAVLDRDDDPVRRVGPAHADRHHRRAGRDVYLRLVGPGQRRHRGGQDDDL